jgi:hypothetical protein
MKKNLLLTAAIALTGFASLSTSQAQFVPNYSNAQPGDLMLGFNVTGAAGSTNLVIDLGSVTNPNTLDLTLNLNSDLTSVFGSNYASTVSYGVYSVDSSKDIFASGATNLPNGGYKEESSTSANTQVNAFSSFEGNYNSAGLGSQTTTYGNYQLAASQFSWAYFTPWSGAFTNANYANIEVAIGTAADLYEQVTHSGASTAFGTNTGFTFDVSSGGELTVVPEPSTYALLVLGAIAVAFVASRRKIKA